MALIKFNATIEEDRQLHISLPEDMPLGRVEVTVRTVTDARLGPEVSREQARVLLSEAGLLSTARYASPDAARLAAAEQEEPLHLTDGAPDTSTLIEESRRERWD